MAAKLQHSPAIHYTDRGRTWVLLLPTTTKKNKQAGVRVCFFVGNVTSSPRERYAGMWMEQCKHYPQFRRTDCHPKAAHEHGARETTRVNGFKMVYNHARRERMMAFGCSVPAGTWQVNTIWQKKEIIIEDVNFALF